MRTVWVTLTVAGALASGIVLAQSGAEVVKTKGCPTCHDAQAKKVGPSYKDVAAKYKGDKAAPGMLVNKLKEGKGHPKVAASDAELKAAVEYVLATK